MKKPRFAALALAVLLLAGLVLPVSAEEIEPERPMQTIQIGSAQELLEFAENCALDTWSQDKQVELTCDISLEGIPFSPIPTFGGTFHGMGHTISGLTVTSSVAPAGLFGILQPSALVEDLVVLGQVCPEGDSLRVGGIVGENHGTVKNCSFSGTVKGKVDTGGIAGSNDGTLSRCQAQGSILGQKRTGGIAGYNNGSILDCQGQARVNTESIDPVVEIQDLRLTTDLSQKSDRELSDAPADTGGIAGYNSGTISQCLHTGSVGYPHIGYNLGGITGRTCGFVQSCRSEGSVTGRKDVGGIAGQVEPHIQTVLSPDYIQTLSQQFDSLGGLVSRAGHDGAGFGSQVQSSVQAISGYQSSARSALESLASGIGEGEVDFEALEQLGDAVHGMASASGDLRSTIGHGVDNLSSNISAISNQIGAISRTFALATEEAQQETITDISSVDLDAISEGRVVDCRNSGTVEGDLNVGGITGVMGLESSSDPEDDRSGGSLTQRKRYELKAIVESCENLGPVTGKRSYVGSVCGRMELGLICQSRGYGAAASDHGDYVGGIAGLAGGTIRQCLSKCTLSGGRYVGGIVGSGITEDYGGGSSSVSQCYAMVEIPQAKQYIGAIAGAKTGTFSENYFVSDTLEGINGVSYRSLAEPVSYEKLCQAEGIPNSLRDFTLTFQVDDKTIKTVPFRYGDSFDHEVYPKLPQREGYYARWSQESLEDLRFDTVVQAHYYPYLTALPSQQQREKKALLFVQGQFQEGDALDVTAGTSPCDLSPVEQWKVTIPADGQQTHTLRYLPSQEDVQIYLLRSGSWTAVPEKEMGAYLSFCADGPEVEFAVVPQDPPSPWLWVAGAVLALGILALALMAWKKRRERGRKFHWILGILAVVVAAAVAVGVFWLPRTKAVQSLQAYEVIKTYLSQPQRSLTFQADAQINSQTISMEAQIDSVTTEQGLVTRIQGGSRALYYYGDVVFLENGASFRLNSAAPNYAQVLQLLQEVYQKSKLSSQDNVLSLRIDGDQATDILKLLMPQAQALLPAANQLTVDMVTEAGALSQLRFTAAGNLTDSVESPFALSALIQVQAPAGPDLIPPAVLDAITSGNYQPQEVYSDDLVRLLDAWTALKERDVLCADVTLQAQCGPLDLEDTFQLCQWSAQGIRGLRREDLTLYFTDSQICDKDGHKVSASAAKTPDAVRLAEIALDNIENTAFQCRQEGQASIYSFTMNPTGMKQILLALLPQAQELSLDYGEGTLELVIQDGELTQLRLASGGSGTLAGLTVDIQLSLEALLTEPVPQPTLPEAVKKALTTK